MFKSLIKKSWGIPLIIIILTLALILLWAILSFLYPNLEEINKLEEETIAKIKSLPDNEINIGETALVFAKRIYPRLDVKKYLKKLDKMADEIKVEIGTEQDPKKIIRIINNYLFERKKLTALFAVRNTNEYIEGTCLNRVLDSMAGYCSGLSTLYLALAERINLPIYGVRAHRHFFVRYDNGVFKRNIETLYKGKRLYQHEYEKQFGPESKLFLKLSPEIINYICQGYFVNLSKKEFLTQLLFSYYSHFLMPNALTLKNYAKSNNAQTLAYFEKTLKISASSPKTGFFLVLVDFMLTKNYELPLSCIDKMTELYPKEYHTYLQRLFVHLEGTHELDKALQDANKALELNQTDPQIYHNRGRVYYAMNDTAKALNDFDKAVELSPITYGYLPRFYQATIMFEKGSLIQALNLLWSIIKTNPNYAPAYYLRAKIYLETKQYFFALRNFKEYIRLSPDSPEAQKAKIHIKELEEKIK